MKHHNLYGIIIALGILILVFSSVGWAQPPQLAQALPPAQTEPAGLTVEVTGPVSVTVGSTFEVNVVASNIPDPGIFGYQFTLNWDDTVLAPVSGTLTLNSDFSVVAKSEVGATDILVAASREGDVADLTGPLTLLSWTFQANTVTDPDATSLTLNGVKLGRKGGLEVPVEAVIGLDVVVTEGDGGGDESGDILGNVTVEGRAADNQAGHTITDGASLSTTTAANGDFVLADALFGTYDLTANSPGFLAATCEGVDHSVDPTTLDAVVLLAGDINDDGTIDITDAVAIGLVFGTADEVSDLNDDGQVDILDLILMAVNFGQTSAGNPWACQPDSL